MPYHVIIDSMPAVTEAVKSAVFQDHEGFEAEIYATSMKTLLEACGYDVNVSVVRKDDNDATA